MKKFRLPRKEKKLYHRLDFMGKKCAKGYYSDFENKLEYLKAHYQPRIEIIKQTINYLETKTNRLAL